MTPSMTQKSFAPTAEQEAIIHAALQDKRSIMVTAYAGCAKSTSLRLVLEKMNPQPCLAVMFNVRNKKEAEKIFPSWVEVKTLNGLGHSAWQRAIGRRLEIDEKKLGRLITQSCKSAGLEITTDDWNALRAFVSRAQQSGMVPSVFPHKSILTDTEAGWQSIADEMFEDISPKFFPVARDILIASINESFKGIITYDDQVYCSAMLGGQFPRFPLVLVDEAQDLSPLNHIQVRRSAADRLIVVGDPKQAIYAFRGADSASIENLRKLRPEWIDLPLAMTFRVPHELVRRQLDHAPGFIGAPGNAQGQFLNWHSAGALPQPNHEPFQWTWEKVTSSHPEAKTFAVLCRNNAPLLSLAFKLLAQQVGVVMLGRDIGKGLTVLAKKICPQAGASAADTMALILRWQENEVAKARLKDDEGKIAGIYDRAECLQAVLDGAKCETAGDLVNALELLFSRDQGQVTLSTGHRAKGSEWDLVIHLDPWRIPSKFARTAEAAGDPRQMSQERNLRYVIETRAKHTLILANLGDFL